MNSGLNAFAKEFLKNGVEYRLELGFTDEKLGVQPGDIYYDVVKGVIGELQVTLNDPLYGPGSIQERAAAEGIEIPDSEYKDGWDLATELVAAHYAGSENYPLNDRDVKIFLCVLSYVIRGELETLEDETIVYDWAEAIILATSSSLGGDAFLESVFPEGGVTPAEYLAVAMVSPLLQSFTVDDNVDDNCGTLQGYARNENASNIGMNLLAGLTGFIDYLMIIINYVLKALGMAV